MPVPAVLVLAVALAAVKPPIQAGELEARLDAYLTGAKYEGAALVAKDGAVVLMKGYGLADREKGTPWAADTLVSIGSITKQFTAAAILKLESEGRLSVQDTVGKFWKNAPEDKRGITLHQLLTHTSGLESDFAGDYDRVGRDEYVGRVLGSKLKSKPGTEYFYANSGYSLLAAIVELASGRPYETYLRESLLLPAGMKETGYRLPKWDPSRIPVGYRDGKRWGTMFDKPWAEDGPYWALKGNGGIESTLSDLWAWSRALDGEAVLPAAARKKLFTPWVEEGPGAGSHYGYGWAIETTPWNTKLVSHNGGNGVFSADFRRYVDDGIVVITAAAESGQKAWKFAGPLARIARGEKVDPTPTIAPAAPRPLGEGPRPAAIQAFVVAFNKNDLAAMRAYRAQYMARRERGPTEEERDQMARRMIDDFGTLTLDGVVGENAEGIDTRMTDGSGHKIRIRFAFTPDDKVSGLMIEAGD